MSSKTYMAKTGEVEHKWILIDAKGQVLGRLASRVAILLRGKHKPTFTPSVDTGDFVIVINAKEVTVTGNKRKDKLYKFYSGYPSGLKLIPFEKLVVQHADRVIELAVERMLPKGPLGRKLIKKLKVYPGPEHPHQSQEPQPMALAA